MEAPEKTIDTPQTQVENNVIDPQKMTASEQELLIEQMNRGELELMDDLVRFFQNKDIIKERELENEILMDKMQAVFKQRGEMQIFKELPDGMFGKISFKRNLRETLDKKALAHTMGVSEEEIKTPVDLCMFVSQGKLTPKTVNEHMKKSDTEGISVKKVKKMPKETEKKK